MRRKFILSVQQITFILLMSVGIFSSFFAELPVADADATCIAYSNDTDTGHVGIFGVNSVICFTAPMGTSYQVCNLTAGGCTGFAPTLIPPGNQTYNGFDPFFESALDGHILEAEPEAPYTGKAQCTMVVRTTSLGTRYYCNVTMPDDDGDSIPNSIDVCRTEGNIGGFGITTEGCPVNTDGDPLRDFEDACPTEGNIGNFGLTPSGCPVNTDGDPLRDFEDACPTEGNIGNFGLTPSGCPVDTDIDGIKDYQDDCPTLGNIDNFGIDSFGCPTDTDSDGYYDYQDFCKTLGDIDGYGVDSFGCPTDTDGDTWDDYFDTCINEYGVAPDGCPPKPKPGDSDGDGVLNDADECVNIPGTLPNGCPDPNLQCPEGEVAILVRTEVEGEVLSTKACFSVSEDWDNDAIINGEDACPLEKGPLEEMAGCPYPADECEVSFKDSVVLYNSPNGTTDITVDYNDYPMTVIEILEEDGLTWYHVLVRAEYTRFIKADDTKINFGGGFCGGITVEILYKYFEDAGCAITQNSPLNLNPELSLYDVLITAAYRGQSICDVAREFEDFSNGLPQRYTSAEVIQRAFRNSPDVNEFVNRLKTCEISVVDFLAELVQDEAGKAIVEILIESATRDGKDPCEEIRKWRGNNPIELPPDTPIDDQIAVGILVCNTKLTPTRYNELRVSLRDVWQIYIPDLPDESYHDNNGGTTQVRLSELTCRNIESALRLGRPTPAQQLIYDKLRECGFDNPIWRLEIAIRKNNDKAEYAEIENCAEFNNALNRNNEELYPLPPEFNICAITKEDRLLLTIFFKNYVDVEPPLISEEQLAEIKAQPNPCKAVTEYLKGRELPPIKEIGNPEKPPIEPILAPPVDFIIPPPPLDTDNDGFADDSDECPNEYGVQPRGCLPQTTNTPSQSPLTVQPFSFERIRLGEFTKTPLSPDEIFTQTMIELYSQVYIDDNNLYLVDLLDDSQEVAVETEPAGEKYAPILFDLGGALILSYILEVGDVFYIRIVNLDIPDGNITLQLPDGVVVDAETRIAFNEGYFVFDGVDNLNNNQRNIYMLNMTGSEMSDQLPTLFISNAKDPASVEGEFQTFIFVAIGNKTGSIFKYDGQLSNGQAYLYSLDGFGKSCKRPLAEEYSYDIQYWFLCDVNGNWTLFVNSNASQYQQNREPNSIVSNLDITFQNITLGLDANSLFIDKENEIHQFMGIDNINFIQEGHSMFTLRD